MKKNSVKTKWEALAGDERIGINHFKVNDIADEIKALYDQGMQKYRLQSVLEIFGADVMLWNQVWKDRAPIIWECQQRY